MEELSDSLGALLFVLLSVSLESGWYRSIDDTPLCRVDEEVVPPPASSAPAPSSSSSSAPAASSSADPTASASGTAHGEEARLQARSARRGRDGKGGAGAGRDGSDGEGEIER